MGELTAAYDAFAVALNYPTDTFYDDAQTCIGLLSESYPQVAKQLGVFAGNIKNKTLPEVEEAYIKNFDLNPDTTLDTGWHLFGEDYNRGLYLVKLRTEMERLGIQETAELPDHLTHVLALLGRMEKEEAENFAVACVIPALRKTIEGIEAESLYYPVLEGLINLLVEQYGEETEQEMDAAKLLVNPRLSNPKEAPRG